MASYLLESTEARLHSIGSKLRVMGGVNEVPADVWEAVKDHYALKALFDSGVFKWVGDRRPGVKAKGPVPAYPLKGLSSKESVAIVKKATSIETLENWLRQETRKDIAGAIAAQIAEIKRVEEDEEEKSKAKEGKEGGK